MQILKLLLLFLFALTNILYAQADKVETAGIKKELGKEEKKRFKQLIMEGRSAHLKKNDSRAVQAFKEALSLDPSHTQTLSELGYTLFFLKDYPEAEAYSLKALASSNRTQQKASILYHLALIAEAQGNRIQAIEYCVESLKLRPNYFVKEKLALLDPQRVKAFNILKTKALLGPYQDVKEFCKELHHNEQKYIDLCHLMTEELEEYFRGQTQLIPKAGSPFEGVYLLHTPTAESSFIYTSMEVSYYIVIKTKRGFFINPEYIYIHNPGMCNVFRDLEFHLIEEAEFIKNKAPELKFNYKIKLSDGNFGGSVIYSVNKDYMVFCGMGASEIPSCTKHILSRFESDNRVDESAFSKEDAEKMKEKPQLWEFKFQYLRNAVRIKLDQFDSLKAIPHEALYQLGEKTIFFP